MANPAWIYTDQDVSGINNRYQSTHVVQPWFIMSDTRAPVRHPPERIQQAKKLVAFVDNNGGAWVTECAEYLHLPLVLGGHVVSAAFTEGILHTMPLVDRTVAHTNNQRVYTPEQYTYLSSLSPHHPLVWAAMRGIGVHPDV